MKENMKQRYRVFLRPWGTFYCEDLVTGKQETLKTRDKDEAFRLVAAKNENEKAPAFSLHLARVYWKAGDPAGATRTWQHVMDEIPKLKKGNTRNRWLTAIKDKALDSIRNMVVLETQAEHFLKVLEKGSVCTNIYLRRIHNFALDMNWLLGPVIPKRQWPEVRYKDKRAITADEHQRIVEREPNLAAAQIAQRRLSCLKLELKANDKGQSVKMGDYEQNIGLKQGGRARVPPA